MEPDASYVKLQRERKRLIERNEQPERRAKLFDQLESKFTTAWKFGPDRLRLGYRLSNCIHGVPGFDHCSYYTGINDQRIIVTQPYGDYEADLRRGLALGENMSPEISAATEWAFYYPGHASLIIIKFPYGYAKARANYEDAILRGEVLA